MSRMASRTIDGPGSGLGPLVPGKPRPTPIRRGRPKAPIPKGLAASLAVFLLLSVMLVASRPAAAVSGTLEVMYDQLHWPVALAFAPDGRIFFATRYDGRIMIIENGTVLSTPFYQFDHFGKWHDQGLLGLALDPSFPNEPWVYAYYSYNETVNGPDYNRIVRVQATGDTGGSMEVLLDHIPTGVWHIGGPIQFGPDGKLYAVIGDSYNAANAQNLTSLAGKVLRLNPDGSVPDDNPFAGNSSVNPYIFTYGHRNNFGIAFQPTTGDAFVTENGPTCNDEVNRLIPGRNYGWGPVGFAATAGVCPSPPSVNDTNQDGPDPVLPLIWYTPNIAPTNAIIYDGPNFAPWHGDMFFGTWNTRNLHHLHLAPPLYDSVVSDDIVTTLPDTDLGGVLDVEVGLDGAIWLTSQTSIYRFYDTSPLPIASFTTSPTRAFPGDAVVFNGSASYDPNGSIQSYAWDFGDGFSASGVVVSHTYSTYGEYEVTLVVTDFDNLTGSETASIRVLALPSALFAFGPPKPLEGASVTFDASKSTDPDGNISEYRWEWGDGSDPSLATQSVADHTFAKFGEYLVKLTVTDTDGLTDSTSASVRVFAPPSAAFTFSPASPHAGQVVTLNGSASFHPDSQIVSYEWDLGDGSTGTGPIVQHRFSAAGSYLVALTIMESEGFTATAYDTLSVNASYPPVASFAVSSALVSPGTEVTFNASQSTDPQGSILAYTWDFGDGTTGADMTTVHGYPDSGAYTVTLTVLDDASLTGSTSRVLIVNAPPVAAFAFSPLAPFAVDTIVFNGSTSSDPEGSLVGFEWTFGDSSPMVTGREVSHAYAQAGTYLVTLRVIDSVGQTDTRSMNVIVWQDQPPVAVLAISRGRVNLDELVTFDATASTDPDGSIASYSWDFGDGMGDQGVSVVHAYTAPGTYRITLTVTDNRGASNDAVGYINVNAPPAASFNATPASAYPGVYISFNASESSDPENAIVSYHWDFGDGITAEGVTTLHAFAGHGSFAVRLNVTDDLGAYSETTRTIEIGNRGPIIESATPPASLMLNTSESTTFQVGAFDPDGDPLTYAWTVNGVPVGESSSAYEFGRNETGTFVVKVVVSDGSASADFQWVVEVRARSAPAGPTWSFATVSLAGIAVGVPVVLLLFIVLMIRRRRSG